MELYRRGVYPKPGAYRNCRRYEPDALAYWKRFSRPNVPARLSSSAIGTAPTVTSTARCPAH